MMRFNLGISVGKRWWVLGLVLYLVAFPRIADAIPHYWGSEAAKAGLYGLLCVVAGYKLPLIIDLYGRRHVRAALFGVIGVAGWFAMLHGAVNTIGTLLAIGAGCLLALAALVVAAVYSAALIARGAETTRARTASKALGSMEVRTECTRLAALLALAGYAAAVIFVLPAGQGPYAAVAILAAAPAVMITSGVLAAWVLGVPSIWRVR